MSREKRHALSVFMASKINMARVNGRYTLSFKEEEMQCMQVALANQGDKYKKDIADAYNKRKDKSFIGPDPPSSRYRE